MFSVLNVMGERITAQNQQEIGIIIDKNILNQGAGGFIEYGVLIGGKIL